MSGLIQIAEPGQSKLPHQDEEEIAIGIDLGTTNSVVAISEGEQPQTISDEQGNFIVPSIVISDDGKSYISSVKRLIGKGFEDITGDVAAYGYEIIADKSDKVIHLKLGDKEITPIEASARILSQLKMRAQQSTGKDNIKKAVITVPAYFNDAQRQATKDAAKIAGLEVLRLINEPTAAALAYGLDKGAEGTYAIYDLGGGTFDVSILKMQMGVFQVVATGGDTMLGGDDFDLYIIDYIKQNVKHDTLSNLSSQKLKVIAKEIKENLSSYSEFEADIAGEKITIKRESFEKIIDELASRTISVFSQVLKDSKISAAEIKGVVLVGGSTRIPLIRQKIKELIGQEPLSDIDPDKVVAMGAAIQAEALTRGSDNLLLDVTPLSLGLETYGGLMEVLIARNTPIPAKISQKFTTYEDGQSAMKVHVLQGEREMVDDCRSLAQFDLKGIPPKPSGTAVVEITFMLDADGILKVSACEETTGIEQVVEVKPSYGLNAEEMEKILITSMETAREDIAKRLLQEARVEASFVLKTIESALLKEGDLIEGDYRKSIEKQINSVKKACEGEDREAIDYQVKQLDELASDFADARVSKALKGYLSGKNINEI